MDGVDIIAESQTESVLSALDRGDADDKVRDQVSAALLRAMTRMSVELKDIKTGLWKMDELKDFVDDRHDRKCRDCPAKKMAEAQLRPKPAAAEPRPPTAQPQGVVQWVLNLAGNSGFQFFILLLLLISAFIYLTTGKSGVDATRDTVNTLIHGGVQ